MEQTFIDYFKKFPKVKIIHLKKREGLIRARLIGVSAAKGETVTFLDSHVECSIGWLEPMLDRIRLNNKTVVSPVIDNINANTLQ